MEVTGLVIKIKFQNDDNSFTAFIIKTETGKYVSANCNYLEIIEGMSYKFAGDLSYHNKYGEQLIVYDADLIAPSDRDGIIDFLSTIYDGIGPKTARTIVDTLGLKCLDLIDEDPKILYKIPGIGHKKGEKIIDDFVLKKSIRKNLQFLREHEISLKKSYGICEKYGEQTQSIIKNNPYILIQDIEGIGFKIADKIALSLGFDRTSDFRIAAGILYSLDELSSKGDTYCYKIDLINRAAKILGIDDEGLVERTLNGLINKGEIIPVRFNEIENLDVIACKYTYFTEQTIANDLLFLVANAKNNNINIEKHIQIFEQTRNIELHETQKHAIDLAINSGVVVITGGPGTGKTTIIDCIIEINDGLNRNTALAAPTGRAAMRMAEATGREAKTIHRLLGMSFEKGKAKFKYNFNKKLPYDTLILDEISMLDIYIFKALLKAMPCGSRLILVGDKDQLPSIAPGNILADIIASEIIPVCTLTEIYRQAADSLIVTNAHKINKGEFPVINNNSKDFVFLEMNDPEQIYQTVMNLVKTNLPERFNTNYRDIQVLAPQKEGQLGVLELNKGLQNILNHVGKPIEEKFSESLFRIGDKVMHIKNNYLIKWKKPNGECGEGVFNGEIGYIINCDKGTIKVEFEDGKIVEYSSSEKEELMLSYAISVHKSQGCEFPILVLVLFGHGILFNRNLLYTAITRAKDVVYIVGERSCLSRAILRQHTVNRKTLLKHFLVNIFNNRSKPEGEEINVEQLELLSLEDDTVSDEFVFVSQAESNTVELLRHLNKINNLDNI